MKYKAEAMLVLIEGGIASLGLFEQLSPKVLAYQRLFDDPSKAAAALTLFEVTVLAVYIAFKLATQFEVVKESIGRFEGAVNVLKRSSSTIQCVMEQEFYSRFSSAIKNARQSIFLAHLDTMPPSYLKGQPGHDYYERLVGIIKSNRVKTRRVERLSKEKMDWIKHLCARLEGCPQFSLRLIDARSVERRVPEVSVQCLDDIDTVLVAVAEHSNETKKRDIWIQDREATLMWRDYYDDFLWKPSISLIENGVLDRGKLRDIERLVA